MTHFAHDEGKVWMSTEPDADPANPGGPGWLLLLTCQPQGSPPAARWAAIVAELLDAAWDAESAGSPHPVAAAIGRDPNA